jgi:hypothetical protein
MRPADVVGQLRLQARRQSPIGPLAARHSIAQSQLMLCVGGKARAGGTVQARAQ